ncbi:hypothetical protein RJT34_31470 [Clitoria ternatea]|uniref:Uncharacterized protein n=1 Tax=Clitoria ternatea TaxID=43366 RepID=A0AAN9I2X1_CLITE
MASKCSLFWVVLVLCMLSFSAKNLATATATASHEIYANENGVSRRLLLGQERVIPCRKRGRLTLVHPKQADDPHCHNYL